jgi:hypothetical protein
MKTEFNIFVAIFEEASSEPTEGIKQHVMEREGKLFWEDNKKWQEDENLTPKQLLDQIIQGNKINTHTGYETI